MIINVVTVKSGWILQKIAERIADSNPIFELSHEKRDDVDANYYVDVTNCFYDGFKSKTLDVVYFSHLHKNSADYVPTGCLKADFIVHKCSRYYNLFKQLGFNEKRMALLYPFEILPHFNEVKKPKIGIFQRGEHEGKGFNFLLEFTKRFPDLCRCFQWMFIGGGWGEVKKNLIDNGCLALESAFGAEPSYDHYPSLYKDCDYILIPSKWEAGPLSFAESLALGIPTIAADVGWCNYDFVSDYLFPPGDKQKLKEILEKILQPIYNRRQQVEKLNFKYYGEQIVKIVENLKQNKNEAESWMWKRP